jgi:hypothetical protein
VSVVEVLSRAQLGLSAPLVHVEVHLASGLPDPSDRPTLTEPID